MIDYDLLKEINANSNDELELIILEIANLKKRERDFVNKKVCDLFILLRR